MLPPPHSTAAVRTTMRFPAHIRLYPPLLVTLILLSAISLTSARSLENPLERTSLCNAYYHHSSHACDPSGLISASQRRQIDAEITALQSQSSFSSSCESYRLSAVVVSSLSSSRNSAKAAEIAAKRLFIDWGLGECGVLIFVAMRQKKIYVAVGRVARQVLGSPQTKNIIREVAENMAGGMVGRGLLEGVKSVGEVLNGRKGYEAVDDYAQNYGENTRTVEAPANGLWGWELTLAAALAGVAVVVACCNGVSGSDKVELRKLLVTRRCAICLEGFGSDGAPRNGGGNVSAGNRNKNDASAGTKSGPGGSIAPWDDAASEGEEGEVLNPARANVVLACGHRFHLDHRSEGSWFGVDGKECPLCEAAQRAGTFLEAENADVLFRLARVRAVRPELGDAADRKLRQHMERQSRRRDGGGDYGSVGGYGGAGWMLGAAGTGLAVGSMIGGWGQGQGQGQDQGQGQTDSSGVTGDGGGWFGEGNTVVSAGGGNTVEGDGGGNTVEGDDGGNTVEGDGGGWGFSEGGDGGSWGGGDVSGDGGGW